MIQKSIIPNTWQEMAGLIDYSNLAVDARESDIRLLGLEAQRFGIPTVVVNPVNVRIAAQGCRNTSVKVASAVSYPLGAYPPDSKALEIREAMDDGANSIYMLMAVGAFREGLIEEQTKPEIVNLAKAANGLNTTLITEGSVLTTPQKIDLVKIAIDSGINNIAVCSGFDRSRLPEITDKEIGEFVVAAKESLGVIYMGQVDDLTRATELIKLGITRICTPDARRLLQGYSTFPFN